MLIAEIPVCMPFPWEHLLGYVGHRLVPEFESVEGGVFRRRSAAGLISVSFDAGTRSLRVDADAAIPEVAAVRSQVAELFAVEHDAREITAQLERSAELAWRLRAVPGMRPVGAWSAFELCVRTVIGQQVTVAAARTLMQRIVQRCGEVTAERLLASDLSNIGMPGKRVQTLLALAQAVIAQRVQLQQPWTQVNAALQTVPGFGPWTRSYLAIRLGREPDAFPETDLGLVRAAQVDSPKALLARAQAWRPYRAYAAIYLWSLAPPAVRT
jgi:DNA-3-methyladenine glycosylase II